MFKALNNSINVSDIEQLIDPLKRNIGETIEVDKDIFNEFKKSVEKFQKQEKVNSQNLVKFKTLFEIKEEEFEKYQAAQERIKAKAKIISITAATVAVVVTISIPALIAIAPNILPYLGISPYGPGALLLSLIKKTNKDGLSLFDYYKLHTGLTGLYGQGIQIYTITNKYLWEFSRAIKQGGAKKYISNLI